MTDPHRSHHAVKYSFEPHIHIIKHDILLKTKLCISYPTVGMASIHKTF